MIDLSESIKNMLAPSDLTINKYYVNDNWLEYYFWQKQAERNPNLIKIKQLRKELKERK